MYPAGLFTRTPFYKFQTRVCLGTHSSQPTSTNTALVDLGHACIAGQPKGAFAPVRACAVRGSGAVVDLKQGPANPLDPGHIIDACADGRHSRNAAHSDPINTRRQERCCETYSGTCRRRDDGGTGRLCARCSNCRLARRACGPDGLLHSDAENRYQVPDHFVRCRGHRSCADVWQPVSISRLYG